MKKFFLSAITSLCLVAAFAQEKIIHDANAEVRTVSSFSAIQISQGIELLLTQGTTEAVAVSAEEKEHRDAIKTEVKNGELKIYIEQSAIKWWRQLIAKGKKAKAYVSFVNLERINGSSGAKVTIDGSIKSAVLSLDLSSGATIKGNLKSLDLSADLSSGGTTSITGTAENLRVSSSSGGHFNGYDLVVIKCKAQASSGGKIQLNVTDELAAYASSGGGIDYKGDGIIRDVSASSGGKIKKR